MSSYWPGHQEASSMTIWRERQTENKKKTRQSHLRVHKIKWKMNKIGDIEEIHGLLHEAGALFVTVGYGKGSSKVETTVSWPRPKRSQNKNGV